MYVVDGRVRVVELHDVPKSSLGAPIPCAVADERHVILADCIQDESPGGDGSTTRVLGPVSVDEPIAVIRFNGCTVPMFGPPNDDAFALATRGVHPYGVFRIEDPSWIRKLERMNSVHRSHRPERYATQQRL
jgi:hypothetical protein